MNKLKKNLVKIGALLAAAIMVGGWFVTPIDAGNARDCDDNAVIKCGTLTTGELNHALTHGGSGPYQGANRLRALFAKFGLERSDIGHLKNGRVTKSGLVYVGNKVVARNVKSIGRHYMPGSTQVPGISYPLYMRRPAVSFRSNSLDAFVLMNYDGSMAVAVIKSCGNIVPGVGKRVRPKNHFIRIKKFNDLNGNGKRESGESYLAGFSFRIKGPTINKVVKTDNTGQVRVDRLPNGKYTITEIVPSGWIITTKNPLVIWHTNNQIVEFGNKKIQPQETQLQVVKYHDRNGNAVQDEEDEELLSGWQFRITGPNSYDQTITTGEDGTASLEHLQPGKYTVTEILQNGWENTTGLTQEKDIVVNKSETFVFGNRKPELPPPPPEGGEEIIPAELPVSGPGDIAGAFLASISLAGTGLSFLKSKKSLLAAFRK